MRRCAFLTLADPADFVIDDALAYEPLRQRGWHVDAVPWRQPGVDWSLFDAVVIRSPWDYQGHPEAFLGVLESIEGSGTRLYNRLDLVRWNVRKTYLRELEAWGVPVVPTVWRERLRPGDLASVLDAVGTDEAVVKPVVSANADGAFRLRRPVRLEEAAAVEAYYAGRALMAQPFLRAVVDEGEFSLFYFGGAYSHAILKTPRQADFRVQEEHGGHIRPVEPSAALRQAGDGVLQVLQALGPPPLYARVDLVRADGGEGFWLMELELVEPALYFRTDPDAARRFADALDARVAAAPSPSSHSA